ncbi:MAG: hypothetical protein U0176_24745 [Bacteroidia bacterium]
MEGILTLSLCVISTCLLLTGLRFVQRFPIDLPLLVGVNYASAALVGWIQHPAAFSHVFAHPVMGVFACLQGFAFFGLFTLMGWMSRTVGVGYMTIVAKMSLVMPVVFAWLYYGDAMPWLRFVGVGLALVAIFLINFGEKGKSADQRASAGMLILLSIVLFLGSGASDILFKILKMDYNGLVGDEEYVIVLFAAAAIASLPVFVMRLAKGNLKLGAPTLLGGLVLGIPNYYSIAFLVGSLKFFDATVFYPINNTAILLVMALVGVVIFREKLNKWKAIGLLLATAAVVMLG